MRARVFISSLLITLTYCCPAQRVMEKLDRGLIAMRVAPHKVFLSWRLLQADAPGASFNIYRGVNHGKLDKPELIQSNLQQATSFMDTTAVAENYVYHITTFIKGKEQQVASEPIWGNNTRSYKTIPLQVPQGGEVMGSTYTYSANDASVADLNGDGQQEIILKWEPSNARNPPQTGFTGNQLLDAYTLGGQHLWRIDLGPNIRSGAAYTQFMVCDLDGDGRAELMCKTADGTRDGKGRIIGDSTKDWRTYGDPKGPLFGKIVEGPEYITVFEGATGKVLATADYLPSRYPLDGWGGIGGNGGNDRTGSRSDRFTACVAYLDGHLPSTVFIRGWYGRTVAAAWDWRGGKLSSRWVFDSKNSQDPYSGMANHNLSVADVDGDGKDEVCVGAMTIDDNGKGLYTTGLRHGDALHLSDLDPTRPGLEVYGIHESEEKTLALKTPGVAMFDAATGEVLWSLFPGVDVGRGVAADIDPRYPGFENWGGPGGLRDVKGKVISDKAPAATNFLVWWDDDDQRELLDKNYIEKWNWEMGTTDRLLTAEGCVANNGTKATPVLSGDILGDWREEVIWRTEDSRELRIYTNTQPSFKRRITLLQDPQYRLSLTWQNTSYNQPPHTGFSFEVKTPGKAKPQQRTTQQKTYK